MTVRNYKYLVGTSPTLLGVFDSDVNNGLTLYLHVEAGGHNVYLGDAQVTASVGYHLENGVLVGPFGLGKGEALYAISDKLAGVDVRVLATGA